jgi:hypothetical protein
MKGTIGATCNTASSAHIQIKHMYTISRTSITSIGSAKSKLDIAVTKERTDNMASSNSLQNKSLEKPLFKNKYRLQLDRNFFKELGFESTCLGQLHQQMTCWLINQEVATHTCALAR